MELKSQQNIRELNELVAKCNYERIRISIPIDKEVSPEAIIADLKAYFEYVVSGKEDDSTITEQYRGDGKVYSK